MCVYVCKCTRTQIHRHCCEHVSVCPTCEFAPCEKLFSRLPLAAAAATATAAALANGSNTLVQFAVRIAVPCVSYVCVCMCALAREPPPQHTTDQRPIGRDGVVGGVVVDFEIFVQCASARREARTTRMKLLQQERSSSQIHQALSDHLFRCQSGCR